jgi:hypothetical protein
LYRQPGAGRSARTGIQQIGSSGFLLFVTVDREKVKKALKKNARLKFQSKQS